VAVSQKSCMLRIGFQLCQVIVLSPVVLSEGSVFPDEAIHCTQITAVILTLQGDFKVFKPRFQLAKGTAKE
jgi:hypothetical protein